MGRKSKLTPDTQKRLLDLIRAGVAQKRAAQACGLAAATFYEWMADKPDFRTEVEKAYAECVSAKVLKLRKYEDDSWQAVAWWLERREREDYGRIDRHEHTGKDGTPMEFHFFLPANDREDGLEYQPPAPSRNGKQKVTAGEG